jgi:hypothetical protein
MAWGLRAYTDLYWLPEGTGGVTLVPSGGQANIPGTGPGGLNSGPGPNAQTLRLQQAETIIGVQGTPPTAGNITSALTQLATDLGSQATVAAVLAQIQNWQLGQP